MAKVQFNAGMTIDGFALDERLHRGGMAEIWRVRHPGIDYPLVMKLPMPDGGGKPFRLLGFEVEQMIMAELAGAHVPRFVAHGDFTAQPHIVMEYVAGRSLRQRLADPPFPLDEVIERAIAMADALGDLHAQHVLHLDLEPADILFRPSGEVVLIDFSRARHAHLPDLIAEQKRQPAGATEYMAPELLLRVRSDKRSDIFALGAILYQMATGKLPFGVPARVEDVQQRVWRDPAPPRKLKSWISPGLQEVILKCLEPLPDRRYATAEELSFDLRNLDLVELTERAARSNRTGFKAALGRRLRVRRSIQAITAAAAKPAPRAPIILVAVDLRPGQEQAQHALLEAAVSVLANMPGARLACLDVVQSPPVASDAKPTAEPTESIPAQRLGKLRAWAEPLQLPRGKITCHLLDAPDIAAGILDFARAHKVDHLIVGARAGDGATGIGTPVGQSANRYTSATPCTVTLVPSGDADRAGETTANRPGASPAAAG